MQKDELIVRHPIGEEELQQCFDLRHKILRVPWNVERGVEPDEEDLRATHFAVFHHNTKIIGYARMDTLSKDLVQVRYVAIDADYQGKGIGKILMKYIEQYAQDHQIQHIMLHAREIAKKFYLDLGYTNLGKSYVFAGVVQHYKMTKDLFVNHKL